MEEEEAEEDGYEDVNVVTDEDGTPEVFVQISVSIGISCGIRYRDSAIQCWGHEENHRIPETNSEGEQEHTGGLLQR